MTTERIEDFLADFRAQNEAAAVIVASRYCRETLEALSEQGFVVATEYESAVTALSFGTSVALDASDEFSSDLYDLLRQYAHRRGLVQVQPKIAGAASLLNLDTRKTKLLLVVASEHEAKLSGRYPDLLELVAMVERI